MSPNSHASPVSRDGRRFWLIAAVGACLLLLAAFGWQYLQRPPIRREGRLVLTEARVALTRKQYDLVERLIQQIDPRDSMWGTGQLLAGEAAMRAGHIDQALRHYQAIPRDGTKSAQVAAFSCAELHRDAGRLSDALREYLYSLDRQPDDPATHERLAFLYGVTGSRWEALPQFVYLLRHDKVTLDSLALLGDLERPIEQPEYVATCLKNAPNDVLVLMAKGAEEFSAGNAASARHLLKQVVASRPDLLAAQSMLGELLVDADTETFAAWHSRLPENADKSADIWYVRGLRARRLNQLEQAARCFWETVLLIPIHRRGIYQLGQVLIVLGDSAGKEFSDRSSVLFDLTHQLDLALKSHGKDEVAVHKITNLMESSGRIWEARAWARLAVGFYPTADWPQELLDRLNAQITDQTPTTLESANLARRLDLSNWPDDRELFNNGPSAKTSKVAAAKPAVIRFDTSADDGLNFTYLNGSDPLIEDDPAAGTSRAASSSKQQAPKKVHLRTRMFEQTGGGVAVIDFDGDRRPDLCFPQGAPWKFGNKEPTLEKAPPDCLFQNYAGQHFVNVTTQARLTDHGFGQGCSVGDFDNDGFPDLYIANVGCNRLHHNNGDGTFSEVTDSSGIQGNDWTASCVIVDLNADGLPDLFDVTYLTGPTIYEQVCNGHACSPKVFDGVPDRLRLNKGDGTFELIPDATPAVDSKGLGVVAFELNERNRPSLYIANDQVPDFLLKNSANRNSPFNISLIDEGFACGLAYNEDGLAMASMGIAADDVNGDGRIDFFVTNFKDEYDILYLQDAPGLFVDASNSAGLRAATMPYVGWGTQFLDADCNGDMDIVITNGHVDDYRANGTEFQMRPQFFQSTGQGRYEERTAADVGEFFGQKFLGRGLARLDWNGDGKMDFVVSNIAERASLVTNRSTNVGHFVNVILHATTTARDAIGSVVEVTAGERHWTKQLTAGDGYMASNERLLQFGVGSASTISELKITWPSGQVLHIKALPADVTLELVEGSPWATQTRAGILSSLIVESGPSN